MKKFATLAVLAAISATSYAQSSVTLFGVADVAVQVGRGSETNRTSVGSVGLVRASWSRVSVQDTNVQANKFAVGYVHNLSKRTALYTTFAYLKNKNGSALALNGAKTSAGDNSKGLDFGLRHTF